MNKIELDVFCIIVTENNGAFSIEDDLHEEISEDMLDLDEMHSIEVYNNMIDGITSLILAHASAGIDITTPAYKEGVETSIQACGNNA